MVHEALAFINLATENSPTLSSISTLQHLREERERHLDLVKGDLGDMIPSVRSYMCGVHQIMDIYLANSLTRASTKH